MSTRPQSSRAEGYAAPALDRLLAMPAVVDLTSLSKATVYRKIATAASPPHSKSGRRAWPGDNPTSPCGLISRPALMTLWRRTTLRGSPKAPSLCAYRGAVIGG